LDRRVLITERLRLAPITCADGDRLAIFHADVRVMSLLKHGVLSRPQSDAMVADYEAEWSALGFGSWTVTERTHGKFVGLGGLRVDHGGVALRLAFAPEAQGKGYGPEFGRAVLAFAFDVVGLDKVVAITRLDNIPGQRGLEKLGMRRERQWTQEDGRALVLYAAANPKAG
jgi:RimJ/RimL family protein N-acetyltransferase